MNEKETELYNKIRTHLADLHHKWDTDPNKDGHCKSNEGYVGVLFRGKNWFECEGKDSYIEDKPSISMVEVYSYLFGPSRLHQYNSLEEAWNDVSNWSYELDSDDWRD
jgi:hypothetical protein